MKTIRKFQIFALVLVVSLAISCSQGGQATYGSLEVMILSSANTKTILPSEIPDADTYAFALKRLDGEGGDITKNFSLSENGSYLVEDIAPGTYNITVEGLTTEKTPISVGVIDSVTILANETTTKTVYMSLISEGDEYSGSVSVTFDLTDVLDNPNIASAMEGNGIKFVLEYTYNGEPKTVKSSRSKNSIITFKADGIPVSTNHFFTYSLVTWDGLVLNPALVTEAAQIYSGITSTLDGDKDGVVHVADSDIAEALNVYDVTWSTSDASTVTINWKNQYSSDQGCLFETVKVAIWSGDNEPANEDYEAVTVSGPTGSHPFTELTQGTDYKVSFIAVTKDGLESSPYTPDIIINTKVPVQSVTINYTAVPAEINIGTEFTLSAEVYPKEATNQKVIWNITSGNDFVEQVDGGTFRAIGIGTAEITVESFDNPDAEGDSYTAIVKLEAPQNVKATLNTSDITVTWDDVNGAVKYEVYRSEGSGFTKIGETTDATASYTDASIKASAEYRYQVVALGESSEYNSGRSSESDIVYVSDSFITISPPDLGDYGDYAITFSRDPLIFYPDTDGITITAESDVPNPIYSWYINGNIVEDNNTNSITISRNDGSYKNNTLTVVITSSDSNKSYSQSTSFQVLPDTYKSIASISDEGDDNTITYNSDPEQNHEQLSVIFNSDGNIEGDIKWSSLNTNIATVDDAGIVTPKAKGDAVIRATYPATGDYKEITLAIVVPTESVSIAKPDREYLIISGDRAGVTITDAGEALLSLKLSATATGIDGIEDGQTDPIVWSSSNTAAVTVDSSTGLLSAGTQSGVSTITATSGNQSDTYKVYVLQPDIDFDNGTIVTGGSYQVLGAGMPTFDLSLRFRYQENNEYKDYFGIDDSEANLDWRNSGYINYWCFDGNTSYTHDGNETFATDITVWTTENTDGFKGTIRRRTNAYKYNVTAVIRTESETPVMVLSFEATP